MAKANPFASKKAPPFGKKGKAPPFGKKAGAGHDANKLNPLGAGNSGKKMKNGKAC